jgi:hypothetical protein
LNAVLVCKLSFEIHLLLRFHGKKKEQQILRHTFLEFLNTWLIIIKGIYYFYCICVHIWHPALHMFVKTRLSRMLWGMVGSQFLICILFTYSCFCYHEHATSVRSVISHIINRIQIIIFGIVTDFFSNLSFFSHLSGKTNTSNHCLLYETFKLKSYKHWQINHCSAKKRALSSRADTFSCINFLVWAIMPYLYYIAWNCDLKWTQYEFHELCNSVVSATDGIKLCNSS